MSFCLDDTSQITTRFLIDRNYFKPGTRQGSITHSINGEVVGSENIMCSISPDGKAGTLQISFSVNGGPLKAYDYRLETRQSNLGRGNVWYIVCPITGQLCRTLYFAGGMFVSRSAIISPIYRSQTESKTYRGITPQPDPWPAGLRTTYAGKPTKAYLRYKREWEKHRHCIISFVRRYG